MDKRDISTLEKRLDKCNGVDATISISHKLYGDQKVKCCFCAINDEERIGVRVRNGQELFVYKKDLVDYGVEDGIYFADSLMKIEIEL